MENWFRRMNFFKGLFTQAEDWQANQQYHLAKRQFHSRYLHTPGIALGCLEDMRVTATDDGRAVYVAPGYAIDGQGRDLFIPQPQRVEISPRDYSPPTVLYIIARYDESKVERRTNAANPEYTDYAFIEERPVVEATTTEPDNNEAIELARVSLSENATRLRNPRNEAGPGDDEIDMRHVQAAGAARARARLSDIGTVVAEGSTRVRGSGSYELSDQDEHIHIEAVNPQEGERFYLASVFPTDKATVLWRIEASRESDSVVYRLYFKNVSNQASEVRYRVYRFN